MKHLNHADEFQEGHIDLDSLTFVSHLPKGIFHFMIK